MFSEAYLGSILCKLCHYAALGSTASSVFSIVAIALVKYRSVKVSVCMSVCLSVSVPEYLFVCLSQSLCCIPCICLSAYLAVYVCLSFWAFVCLCFVTFVCLPECLSVCPGLCLSVSLSLSCWKSVFAWSSFLSLCGCMCGVSVCLSVCLTTILLIPFVHLSKRPSKYVFPIVKNSHIHTVSFECVNT